MRNSLELEEKIFSIIAKDAYLEEGVKILESYASEGGIQKEAYTTLEDLRPKLNDICQDRLLELMDIVSGFCIPEKKIWQRGSRRRRCKF